MGKYRVKLAHFSVLISGVRCNSTLAAAADSIATESQGRKSRYVRPRLHSKKVKKRAKEDSSLFFG